MNLESKLKLFITGLLIITSNIYDSPINIETSLSYNFKVHEEDSCDQDKYESPLPKKEEIKRNEERINPPVRYVPNILNLDDDESIYDEDAFA